MTYFWKEGYPITVQTNPEGFPHYFVWDWYKGIQKVWMIADYWSVDDLWWVERQKRTYYKVVTERGLALIIFLNDLTREWYIQWVFD